MNFGFEGLLYLYINALAVVHSRFDRSGVLFLLLGRCLDLQVAGRLAT